MTDTLALAQAAHDGDRAAFGQLYEQYQPAVLKEQ